MTNIFKKSKFQSLLSEPDKDYEQPLKEQRQMPWYIEAEPTQAFGNEDPITFQRINNQSLRIWKSGVVTLETMTYDMVLGKYEGNVSVEHGLGFVPTFLAFYKGDSESTYQPISDFRVAVSGGGFDGTFNINAYATSTEVVFPAYIMAGTSPSPLEPDTPYTIKYYILREEVE